MNIIQTIPGTTQQISEKNANPSLNKYWKNRYQISWVVIYPAKDSIQEKLLKEIQNEFNPDNYWTGGGLILKVTEIWNGSHQENEEDNLSTL